MYVTFTFSWKLNWNVHIPFCVTFTFYWEKRKVLWKRLSVFLGFNWSESKSWHGPKWTFIKKIIRLKLFYRPPPLIGNVFNWVFLSNSNWFFLLVSQINPPPPSPTLLACFSLQILESSAYQASYQSAQVLTLTQRCEWWKLPINRMIYVQTQIPGDAG